MHKLILTDLEVNEVRTISGRTTAQIPIFNNVGFWSDFYRNRYGTGSHVFKLTNDQRDRFVTVLEHHFVATDPYQEKVVTIILDQLAPQRTRSEAIKNSNIDF